MYCVLAAGGCTWRLWQDLPGHDSSRCKSSRTRLPSSRNAVTSAGVCQSLCLSVSLSLCTTLSLYVSLKQLFLPLVISVQATG